MSLTSRETSNSGIYRGEGSELDRGIAQPYSPPRNPAPTGKYMGKLTSDEEHIILLEKKCSEFMDSIFKETNPVPTIEEIVKEVKLAYDKRTGERDIKRMKDDSEGVELKHKNTNFQNMNNSGVYREKLTSDEKLNNTQAMTNSKNTSQNTNAIGGNTNEISGSTIVNGGNTNNSGFFRRFIRKLFS